MFNLYINDLTKISNLKTVLFADDSNFLLAHSDPETLNKLVNEQLIKIKDYFNANYLSINTSKTTYIIFCPNQKKGLN